jgi:hypothetical protein
LSKITSINFGLNSTGIVSADHRKGALRIFCASTVPDQDFDQYLSSCPETNFIVTANVKELYQDIIYLPPAKDKFFNILIDKEIKKLHPNLTDYSFFYQVVGDSLVDGKTLKLIVCFVYANSQIEEIISRFTKHGKRVKFLFNSAYALSQFVVRCPETTHDAIMCLGNAEGEKTLSLITQKKLYFIRTIQSYSREIDEIDEMNINMTIDHCFQTLRMKPTALIIPGNSAVISEKSEISLPIKSYVPALLQNVPTDILENYTVPLSALLCLDSPSQGNLLPLSYRTQSQSMDILRLGAYTLSLLCICIVLIAAIKGYSIIGLHNEISMHRKQANGYDQILADYNQINTEFSNASVMLTFNNDAVAQSQQQFALKALSCIRIPGVQTSHVILKQKDQITLAVEIRGELTGSNYSATQSRFEEVLAKINATGKFEISASKLDPSTKLFTVELVYKG